MGLPDYQGLEILSPMVRASSLPLRLCALRYGAGLAYSGVTVDHKLIETVRVENKAFSCVDFVSKSEKRVIFSTCAEERERLIFQIGTADPSFALQAAQQVCRDVRGIDVNFGCCAPFAAQGGMGAELLGKPELVADILKTLRRELPASCAVSCKIRMLPTMARTLDFLQLCERSGAQAIAVHMRLPGEEPGESSTPARWGDISAMCQAVSVPVIANGDFLSRRHIDDFWRGLRGSGVSGEGAEPPEAATASVRRPAAVMIARGALWNPAIFQREGKTPDALQVVKTLIRAAVETNTPAENPKWIIKEMVNASTSPLASMYDRRALGRFKQKVDAAKTMQAVCALFDESYEPSDYPPRAHTVAYGYGAQAPPASDSDEQTAEACFYAAHVGGPVLGGG